MSPSRDSRGPRATRWCFTLYHTEVSEVEGKLRPLVEYAIWQQEQCPTTGVLHMQGFAVFYKRKRFSQLKLIWPHAHWETQESTDEKCIAYCSKSESRVAGPWELGTRPTRKRTAEDLVNFLEANPGTSLLEAKKEFNHLYFRYSRNIKEYMGVLQPPRRDDVRVIAAIGPPGIGKTSWCDRHYPDAYWKEPTSEFFDGYSGHSVIIFDDFHGNYPFEGFLRILDRYPCRLNIKGAMVACNARTIVITSNTGVAEWYPGVFSKHPVRLDALLRRIHEYVTDFTQ